MEKLAGTELRFSWVVGDVSTKVEELLFAAEEVVEGVLLPEAATSAERAIDLGGGVVLPGIALSKHG